MTAGIASGLDHVGIVVPDLAEAAAEWVRLGFAPLPVARHAAPGADGAAHPTGTGNCCIMLRQGYLELLTNLGPQGGSASIASFLARHTGIHIITLATGDAEAAARRLRRAGFEAAVATSRRAADPAEPEGPQARFARIPLVGVVPRLQLLQQITPELVWQQRFLSHANHAVALDSVIVAHDRPAVLAAELSRAAGVPVRPDPADGYALPLPGSSIRVLPPRSVAAIFPGMDLLPAPFVAGIVLRTDDGCAAAGGIAGIRAVGGAYLATASGTAVLFRPGWPCMARADLPARAAASRQMMSSKACCIDAAEKCAFA